MNTDWQATLLDLLNTTPVVDGQATEALDGAWLHDHGATGHTVGEARRLRDALQRVVRGDDATALAPYLRNAGQAPHLTHDGLHWRLDADWAARIVLAWGELQASSPGRLRPCANEACQLFLLDTTRAGTAKWCSMRTCGNRMKARRHYDRTAGSGGS